MSDSAAADAPISARRAHTRDRLMEAAAAVFADRGVNGATVEEIAEAAAFTRGAFYSNFADKSELVVAMLNRSMSANFLLARRAVEEAKTSGNSDVENLIISALTAVERADRPERVGPLLDQELKVHAAREPALHAAYLQFTAEATRQLEALISDALDYLGLELTIPFDHAVRIVVAVHEHEQNMAVFAETPADTGPMRTLLLAITRPATAARAGATEEA